MRQSSPDRNPGSAILCVSLLLACLSGCAVHIPAASEYSELEQTEIAPVESALLDIGISQFTWESIPGNEESVMALTDIRRAESRYMPVMLQHTLGETGHWGAIHVLPDQDEAYDLSMLGRILVSSSHTLSLQITVQDASGATWYRRRYTEYVGNNVYGELSLGVNDPFQGIYNRIANDLQMHLQKETSPDQISDIRELARLRFGQRLVPDYYGQFMTTDRQGINTVLRLPPPDAPLPQQMAEIRQRDQAFRELLQTHYFNYAQEIADTYFRYRRSGFLELQDLHDQQADARNQMIEGVFWLSVAAMTADVDDLLTTTASAAMVLKGSDDLLQGISAFPDEAVLMQEITDSFASEVSSEVIGLDERVIILSGPVEEIYQDWQQLLKEMVDEELQP